MANEEPRPLPVVPSIRDSVMSRLESMNIHGAVLAVDARYVEGGGLNTRLAAMYNDPASGWTFAGWLAHTTKPVRDVEAGFEIRKKF